MESDVICRIETALSRRLLATSKALDANSPIRRFNNHLAKERIEAGF